MNANRYARQFARASGPTFQRSDFERAAIAEAPLAMPGLDPAGAEMPMPSPRRMMHIAIDTREQQPWRFPARWDEFRIETERRALGIGHGDYHLILPSGIVLAAEERKNGPDELAACLSSGRDRFMREVDILLGYPTREVIVEQVNAGFMDYLEVLAGRGDWEHVREYIMAAPWELPSRSQMSAESYLGSLARIRQRGLSVTFCDGRAAAIEHALHLFRRALNHYEAQLRTENRGTK